jgi:hypothetical protein
MYSLGYARSVKPSTFEVFERFIPSLQDCAGPSVLKGSQLAVRSLNNAEKDD